MKILKYCAHELSLQLSILFTAAISMCAIPDFLKYGTVTPLYKGNGSHLCPESFRPITSLPPLAKVFEYILFKKLNPTVDPDLSEDQHGFKKDRSCQTALTLFTNDVLEGIDGRIMKVGAVFIDKRKAFCSANKFVLLFKLITQFGFFPISNQSDF